MPEHGQTESDDSFVGFAGHCRRGILHGFQKALQVLKPAEEQLVLVPEVQVESRPAYVRAIQNVLDRNGFLFLLENE